MLLLIPMYSVTVNQFGINLVPFQLHGFSKDGSYHFRFHCTLSAFVQESNDFTKGLAPYVNDPRQFCSNLNRLSDGAIHCDSSQRSSQEHPESSSSQECSNPRKRAKSCEVETEKTKKKKKKSAEHEEGKCSGNRMQLQQEISEHQIGECLKSATAKL